MEINGVEKLLPNLRDKKNYVIHIQSLNQALQHGLRLDRIHRAIEFDQSPWSKAYIDFNTRLRTAAANDFEKDFFKLMNNSVFGKKMENILDLSKIIMYEFRYDYMVPKYGLEKLKLCYMDTDSLVYDIKTEDFYEDIANDVEARFNTSGYSKTDFRPLPISLNKKVIGLMKNIDLSQCLGQPSMRFIPSRSIRSLLTEMMISGFLRNMGFQCSLEVTKI